MADDGGGDAGGGRGGLEVEDHQLSSGTTCGGYAGWAMLAAAGILVYAAATAGTAALIKPIFGRGAARRRRRQPPRRHVHRQQRPTAGRASGASGESADRGRRPELKKHLNVARQTRRTYESLKRRLGVNRDNVVYFLPVLFVIVFLLRCLADFVSGYAFQHIGLGVTTDIRNDLYRSILDQSSRFHAEHPSGELVARVINDVAMMQNAVAEPPARPLPAVASRLVALLALLLSTHFRLALISLHRRAACCSIRSSASARGCAAPATAARSGWPTWRA